MSFYNPHAGDYAKTQKRRELRKKFGWNEYAPVASLCKKREARPIGYNPRDVKTGRAWIENASDGLRVKIATFHLEAAGRHYRESDSWYVDSEGREVTTAHVIQLPARRGKLQFIAATSDPCNRDCFIADFSTLFDCALDAAHGARSLAENYAESCREDDLRFQAECRIETLRDEIAEARKSHGELAVELAALAGCKLPATLARVRLNLAELRAEVRKAGERIRELTENPFAIEN